MASSSSSRPPNHPTTTANPPKSPESYPSLNRRNAAASILQSYEKVSWYSFQRCESLTQTRLHFQNIIAGFTEEDERALVDWAEDLTPRPSRTRLGDEAKGKEKDGSGKGKERVSGGADVVAGSSAASGQKDGGKGKEMEKEKGGKGREKSESSQGGSAKKKRRSGG